MSLGLRAARFIFRRSARLRSAGGRRRAAAIGGPGAGGAGLLGGGDDIRLVGGPRAPGVRRSCSSSDQMRKIASDPK